MVVLPGFNGEDYGRYTKRGCAACVRAAYRQFAKGYVAARGVYGNAKRRRRRSEVTNVERGKA